MTSSRPPGPDVVPAVARGFESIDNRLAEIETRLSEIETDSAGVIDDIATISKNITELRRMFVDQAEGIESVKSLIGNYVSETQELRKQAQLLIARAARG